MISELNDRFKIVLGSNSPRRRELLEQLALKFTLRPSPYEEDLSVDLVPEAIPEFLAEQKALGLVDSLRENELIITADTLVILENRILGKPIDEKEAFDMIKSLSGKWHKVITGVCLMSKTFKIAFSEITEVHFRELNDEEIRYYVREYKPMDKAGAYGIQEWIGLIAVNEIKGCFFNVIGLPVPRLYKELMLIK